MAFRVAEAIIPAFVLAFRKQGVLFANGQTSAADVSLAVIAERNVARPIPPSGFSFGPF